ncbi:hypothetical protein [Brevundimonas aveniformis]|uniref:hypothetical protein n=1 Tax=Brevundimonas aveniformis TaxID=370977 RepID=UPI000428F6E5|nr:hypothetical protein [Brevundimonas aveniformis]
MTDDAPANPNIPPPDIRGRRLDHPGSEPLKNELLELTVSRPLEILVPSNDPEAQTFAGMIQDLMKEKGRACTVLQITFDPPFRGLQIHEGDDKIQLAIGHR